MKKLLLTLLGAAALCGLSPHPAQAQSDHSAKTKTFTVKTAAFTGQTISAGKRIKGAIPGASDAKDFTVDENDEIQTFTAAPQKQDAYGFTMVKFKINENDVISLNFDFSQCTASSYKYTNYLYSSGLKVGAEGSDDSGVSFSIGMGEEYKVKKVKLNFYSNNFNFKGKPEDYLKPIDALGSKADSKEFKVVNHEKSNGYLKNITYEASGLYGAENLILRAIKAPDYGPITIQSIEITYYDNTGKWMPKYEASQSFGKAYGDKISYRTSSDGSEYSEWRIASGMSPIRLTDAHVQTKIGKAITTFEKPSTATAAQATVIIDPAKYYVGATKAVKFYTETDPDFFTSDEITLYYGVKYSITDYRNNPSSPTAAKAAFNVTLPDDTKPTYASGNTITNIINDSGLTGTNSALTVLGKNSTDKVYPLFIYSDQTSVPNTTNAYFAFDGVTLSYTTDKTPQPQTPMAPVYYIPSSALQSPTTGIYNIFSESIDIDVALNEACIYPEAKIQYFIGEKKLDESSFDKFENLENGKIHIDHNCVLSLRTNAKTGNDELTSEVISLSFNKLETVNITDSKQLLDKNNKDKLVRLDFPLQILASGYLNASPKELSIYTCDTLGTAVRLATRVNQNIKDIIVDTEKRLFPGTAFIGVSAQTIASWPFCPAGGAVGTLQFDDQDRPVIVLKDEENDIDNFQYCYYGASITPTAAMKQNSGTFVRNTFTGNKRDKLSADDYGKYVYVIATYNTTDKTFTLVGTNETLPARTTTATGFLNCYPTSTYSTPTTNSLTNDVEYALTGIVEYDAAKQEYYIMPRAINPMPARPKVTTESLSGFTQVIDSQENADGTAGSAIIKLVSRLKLNFTNATTGYYLYSYLNPSTNSITIKGVQKTTGNATINLSSSSFDENKQIVFTVNIQNCAETSAPLYISDPYIFTVTDVVSTAPVYNSMAEVKKELKEKSADDFKDKYFKVAGNMVVLGFDDTNKYMYLRDVDSDGYLIAYSKKGWNFTDYKFIHTGYHDGTTTRSLFYNPRIGDQITEMTFTPKDESGVMIADVSGLEGKYDPGTNIYTVNYQWGYIKGHSYGQYDKRDDPDGTIWGDLSYGDPMYKNHMDRLGAPLTKAVCYDASHPADAAKLTFDDANIADFVNVQNVKLTATEDTDPVFSTDGLGTDLTIDWSMLPADISTAALADDPASDPEPAVKDVKAEIIQAYNDAKNEGKHVYFNLSGYIFKTADAQGYELRIKDYSMTEAAPLPQVKVTVAGNDIEATPAEDDESKLTASFLKTASVSSPDAEAEDADYEILMSVDGGEFEAYDADKLAGLDAKTTVAFKCPVRPGYLAGERVTTLTLDKESDNISTLAEMAQGTNTKNLYHFRKHLKVVAAAEGTVMAADAEGHLAVVGAAPAEAEEGKYLTDVVLVRRSNNSASIHEIDADAELLDEDDSYAIATPEPTTLFGAIIKDGKAVENEGQGASYAIDPTFEAIPTADAEGWKLTGYILPGADSKPVIYLTAAEAVDRVALPVITPAEAAFLDQTTVTIDCATTGAAIEYSTDGGETWTAYSEPFEVEATGDILARATAAGMLPSRQAKASVVREYLSGDVTITIDEQEGKTVITITGPGKIFYSIDGAAEKQYDGAITIANDTQTELSGIIRAYALEEGKRPGAAKETSYKVSGISGIGADAEADGVRVEGNAIIVPEGAQTFDIAGRRVNPQGLSRGIYIVRLASGKAVKVVIR